MSFVAPAAVITVGSTTNTDARSDFSNYGSCVDVFAPGSDILSGWFNSDTASITISDTSTATPHVAGVMAIILSVRVCGIPFQLAGYPLVCAVAATTCHLRHVPRCVHCVPVLKLLHLPTLLLLMP